MKTELLLFQLSVASGLIAWAWVSKSYIWPIVNSKSLIEGARPLLLLNLFRYVGLMFMIPGVVSSQLPEEFASSAGWGDLIAAGLAALTLLLSNTPLFKASLWIFNLFGLIDLLHGFYVARIVLGINPADFGSAFILPTIYVPLLICSHIMIFLLLFQRAPKTAFGRVENK
jgi:hypothetical protein